MIARVAPKVSRCEASPEGTDRMRIGTRHAGRRAGIAAAVFLAVLELAPAAQAVPAVALVSSGGGALGGLVPFDTDNPGGANFGAPIAITGTDGKRVLGIDYRPSTGELYGVDEASRLYKINAATGSASQVGAPGAVVFDPFTGVFQGIGFDFDPTNEQLRATEDDGLVNGQDDNFTIDPDTGIFTQHSDLGGAPTDVDIAGLAYANSVSGAGFTTPYAIETNQPVSGNSRLVVIHPANAGTLFTIDGNANGLGVAVDSQNIGFDISGSVNRSLVTLSVGGVFGLYRIDLEFGAGGAGTGDATLVGNFGVPPGTTIRGFAVVISPPPPPPPAPGPPSGPPPDTTAPNTRITKGPARRTRSRSAAFRFRSTEPASRFLCQLDNRAFGRCNSPKRYRRLRPGQHKVFVAAVDAAGNIDPTPASRTWRIRRAR
jgi:hypothetical protein